MAPVNVFGDTARVEKLRAKFETLMKISGTDDEEGGEKSQA